MISQYFNNDKLLYKNTPAFTDWGLISYGAENEARTRDPHLGKVVLYH